MISASTDLSRVIAVDNNSSDGTHEYLLSVGLGGVIHNKSNLGCGVAWNQGALQRQAEWTIVMNNDVLVASGWVEALISTGIEKKLKLVSPAMIEGNLDYDFIEFSQQSSKSMASALRRGLKHAVCMCIHRTVFEEIGFFAAVPKLVGFEDTLFFHAFDKAGLQSGITGATWIHHFGSVTQRAMKHERGLSERDSLGSRNNSRLLNESYLERKWKKWKKLRLTRRFREQELATFNRSLHGLRDGHDFSWL